jgi:hypothetical protein
MLSLIDKFKGLKIQRYVILSDLYVYKIISMIDSYCNINDAFSGGNKHEISLDQMARQINNNKKMNKSDIYNQYRKSSDRAHKSIEAFNNLQSLQNDKNTTLCPDTLDHGFYSAQGEYAPPYIPKNKSGTMIKNIGTINNQGQEILEREILERENLEQENLEQENLEQGQRSVHRNNFDLSISIDTPSYDSNSVDSSDSNPSYDGDSRFSLSTISTEEIDEHIKTKSRFNKKNKSNRIYRHHCVDFDIDSADSLESLNSGESLLRHIKSCHKCKEKVIDLIKKNKNTSTQKCVSFGSDLSAISLANNMSEPGNHRIDDKKRIYKGKNNGTGTYTGSSTNTSTCTSTWTWLWSPETKEIVTICLFGFLIIIMLDLFMRK